MRTPPQPDGYNTQSLHFARFYPSCSPRSTGRSRPTTSCGVRPRIVLDLEFEEPSAQHPTLIGRLVSSIGFPALSINVSWSIPAVPLRGPPSRCSFGPRPA
jgi:hypothetical protein